MAVVYLARDERHARLVALKVLQLGEASEGGAERFLHEIQVAAGLAHPNILPVYDSGQGEGFLYYVMPYVPGESLRQRLEREGALPLDDALAIAVDVASALAYAHSHNVIHRDIKPENILFLGGHAVVADFGIARAISAGGWSRGRLLGEREGTPTYMSPEQASGGARLDGRSDLYSLGCVLYEMLTGNPPFRGTTPEELVVQHLEAEPEPVQTRRAALPAELQSTVVRALAKHPADRYPTAQQFVEAIQRVQAGRAASATPAATPVLRGWRGAWRWALPAAALAGVLYAGFGSILDGRGLGAGALQPNHLVIAPFVHHGGAAPELLSGEQCARLLREGLSRWDDVSMVDSRWVDDQLAQTSDPSSLRTVLRLARSAHAGRVLSGEVWSFRDSIRIRGVVYDAARNGQLLREYSVTVSPSLEDLEPRFLELRDSLLLPRALSPTAEGGVLGTRVLAAYSVYDSAHADLARWDLAAAAEGFQRALTIDPGYGLAHLWLAQTQSWQGLSPAVWRDHAIAGLGASPPLSERERDWGMALVALAEGRFPEACARYEAMIARDTLDFRGWYGRAECRAHDQMVLPDPTSPSRWRFRTSYQGAINDYQRALLLIPSAYRVFEGAAFARLTRLYYLTPNLMRRGIRHDSTGLEFGALPELDADTLAFIPWPIAEFNRGVALPHGVRDIAAVTYNQRNLQRVAAEWVRRFPASPTAVTALAKVMELSGEYGGTSAAADSALLRYREALALTTRPEGRVQLAGDELRLLVKVDRLAEATHLADSLLRANPAPTADEAPYLAAAAGLLGRGTLAAAFARRAAPTEWYVDATGRAIPVPLSLRETALAFAAFAGLGGPADSLRRLRHQAERLLAGYYGGRDRERADAAIFDRSRMLLFPDPLANPGPRQEPSNDYLFLLQDDARAGRLAALQGGFQRLEAARKEMPIGRISTEALYMETQVLLSVHDTAGAIRRLDSYLASLPYGGWQLTQRVVETGSFIRIQALRARLAAAQGDTAAAAVPAGRVLLLWSRADPAYASLLAEMRALAGRPN